MICNPTGWSDSSCPTIHDSRRAGPHAPILPLRPRLPERQTHDYKRHGTTTLFAAFNILNGKVIGSCLPRHRAKEFIRFLNQLEKEVPPEPDIHLILDNYSTHRRAAVQRWLKPRKRRRFHFHVTPTSGSWLNQIERWFGLITDKMIRRGTFHSMDELERAIYAWLANGNDKPKRVRLEGHRRCHPRQGARLQGGGCKELVTFRRKNDDLSPLA